MTAYATTGSGLIVPDFIIKREKRPMCFDFFCGCGGMGLGIIQAGFEIVGANEFDEMASLTYMVNLGHYPMIIHYLDGEEGKRKLDKAVAKRWGLKKYSSKNGATSEELRAAYDAQGNQSRNRFQIPFVAGSGWIKGKKLPGVRNFWFGDMHKLTGKKILDALGLREGDLDLVCGGPPCQGFSRAGKQEITDPRNALIYEYARMIVELQPKTFIMEEVPDVVNFFDPDGVPVIDKFCHILQNGGYGKWETIKKSLLIQSGSAAVLKSPQNGRSKVKNAPQNGMRDVQTVKQSSMFEMAGIMER